MKGNAIRIVLIVVSAFLLVGAALTGYMLLNLDDRDIINVKIGESGQTSVDFTNLEIVPGETVEYTLSIASELPGDCIMTVEFIENQMQIGDLKNYVYVTVVADGKEVCKTLLKDLFESEEPVSFPCIISKKDKYDVTVKYYMPLDTGDEAQNTDSDFVIKLTVSNEQDPR